MNDDGHESQRDVIVCRGRVVNWTSGNRAELLSWWLALTLNEDQRDIIVTGSNLSLDTDVGIHHQQHRTHLACGHWPLVVVPH